VSTTRLLKAVLPSNCLWTTLRDVEGFNYEKTLQELKTLYPASDEDDDMDDQVLPSSVPKAIREMLGSKTAIEALGALIW
jgi:DNA mismatch repair protein MSH6